MSGKAKLLIGLLIASFFIAPTVSTQLTQTAGTTATAVKNAACQMGK